MKKVMLWGIIILLSVTILRVIPAQEATVPLPPAKPLKIGIANIEEIYNALTRRTEFISALERENKQEEKELKDLEKERKELTDEMENMDVTSKKYREVSEKAAILGARAKSKMDSWNQSLEKRISEQTLKFYKDIRETLDKYAAQNGYTFVFKSDYFPSISQEKSGVAAQISIRPVLVYPKENEITKQVIEIMNKDSEVVPTKKDSK